MACRACGRCLLTYPQKAIVLKITNKNFLKEAAREIESRVKLT